jgi:hypothetical protein
MTQFYGPQEVLSKVEEAGQVTMTLEREDGTSYQMKVPTIIFEKVATPTKKDWNHVQEVKFNFVISKLIEILKDCGITGGEIKSLSNMMVLSYFNVINRAISYQFMGEDESFIPNTDMYFDFTLERAHEITKHLDESTESTTDTAA